MEVQNRPGVQRNVVLGKGDWHSSAQQDLAGAAQPLPPGFHLLRLDGLRAIPFEPEQHRGQRAMATSGGRERPVQLHSDIDNPGEHTHHLELADEVRGRAHRADCMRAGRSDADLEELEHTDGH